VLKIYNPIPVGDEQAYREMLQIEYSAYFEKGLSR